MAKYDVSGTLTISTSIEPEGYIDEPYGSEIEDFSSNVQGYAHDIEAEVEISFVLVTSATDEDDASDEAQDILDNLTYTSQDDVEWEITNVSLDEISKQEMDIEEAVRVVRTFLDSREGAFKANHPQVVEALEVVLQQF